MTSRVLHVMSVGLVLALLVEAALAQAKPPAKAKPSAQKKPKPEFVYAC